MLYFRITRVFALSQYGLNVHNNEKGHEETHLNETENAQETRLFWRLESQFNFNSIVYYFKLFNTIKK